MGTDYVVLGFEVIKCKKEFSRFASAFHLFIFAICNLPYVGSISFNILVFGSLKRLNCVGFEAKSLVFSFVL